MVELLCVAKETENSPRVGQGGTMRAEESNPVQKVSTVKLNARGLRSTLIFSRKGSRRSRRSEHRVRKAKPSGAPYPIPTIDRISPPADTNPALG